MHRTLLLLLLLGMPAFAGEDVVKDSKGNEWRVKKREFPSRFLPNGGMPHVVRNPPEIIDIATAANRAVASVSIANVPWARRKLTEEIEEARAAKTLELTLPPVLWPPPAPAIRAGSADTPLPGTLLPDPVPVVVTLAQAEGLLEVLHQYPKPPPSAADLTTEGLSWDEKERTVEATEEGQARLKNLTAILPVLRVLKPRELDFAGCKVLENVDGLRDLPTLEVVNLSECPALKNVDGIAPSKQMKKIYLFQSTNVAEESVDALVKRFPKCYLVLPDGTGLNPPRGKE